MTQMDVQPPTVGGATMIAATPVIEMRDISIAFGGVRALDRVNLRLLPGEVHALIGENGAGKSTLIKALTGVYSIDSGTVLVGGEEHVFTSPAASQAAGISTVYQEVNLVPNLTVAENMLLGREPRRFGSINVRAMNRRARETLESLGLDIDPTSVLGAHPIAIQQLVAIARAVDVEARVLILDEPTSSLDADEVAKLFALMRRLREQGVAIVFVSHFLDQIYEIADRMTILRNGALVGERLVADITQFELVKLMIGRELEVLERLDRTSANTEAEAGTPIMKALGVGRKGSLEATDLELYEGEIIGLAGLLGSGRTELARLLFGADTADTGEVAVRSERRKLRSPRHAIDRRIAFSSEDRKAEGVVGDLTVADNMLLALQASRGWLRPIPHVDPQQAGRGVHQGPRHPAHRPERPDAQPLGRQPAEGAAGAVADHQARHPDPRRAHPRHRHRRQGPDPGQGRRAGRAGASRSSSSPGSWRRCCASATVWSSCATAARSTSERTTTSASATSWRSSRARPAPSRRRLLVPESPTLVRRILGHQLVWPVLALLVLLAINVVATPSFLDIRMQDGHLYGNVADIVRNSAPVMLVALGMTLVIATRGIDLSVGAIAAIAAAVACTRIVGAGDEGALATAVMACTYAVVVCLVLGAWNGFLVSVLGIQPIIASLVLMVAGRGISMAITDGQITTVHNDYFSDLASGFVLTLPVAFLIALAVFGLTALLTRRTALGMLIEAVGINPEASRLAGVRSRTIIWIVYAFSGFCSGIAGLVIAANTNSVNANSLGLWIELDAILAVVIGGTSLAGGRFSLTGTLIGALFIATLARTIPNIGIPSELNYLFKAVVVIVVCLLQSPKARAVIRIRRSGPANPVLAKAGSPA